MWVERKSPLDAETFHLAHVTQCITVAMRTKICECQESASRVVVYKDPYAVRAAKAIGPNELKLPFYSASIVKKSTASTIGLGTFTGAKEIAGVSKHG